MSVPSCHFDPDVASKRTEIFFDKRNVGFRWVAGYISGFVVVVVVVFFTIILPVELFGMVFGR